MQSILIDNSTNGVINKNNFENSPIETQKAKDSIKKKIIFKKFYFNY